MPAIDPSKICVTASLVTTHHRPKTGGARLGVAFFAGDE